MQPTVFILCVLVSNIEAAVDAAVEEMPDSFELKEVLLVLKAQGKTDEEIAEFERQMATLSANG